jgi:hypothetical protein
MLIPTVAPVDRPLGWEFKTLLKIEGMALNMGADTVSSIYKKACTSTGRCNSRMLGKESSFGKLSTLWNGFPVRVVLVGNIV